MTYLGRHCPSSCWFHWWWEWLAEADGTAKPHRTGVTVFGYAWYWGPR